MFIKVRYGNDEMILCNPHCIVSNLLASITARCGMKNSSRTLDLSDESGLVLRLNDHRDEHANLHLKNFSTYILVEKQEPLNSEEEDILLSFHRPLEDTPLISYVPLLENYSTLLPKFKLRVAMENAVQHPHRHPKSPRPASRANHGHVANKSPSRKVKRAKAKTPKDSR